MAISIGIAVCILAASAIFVYRFRSSQSQTRQPTINDLVFPVAVFIRPEKYYVDLNPSELTTMDIQQLNYLQDYAKVPAQLIDNELNLFQLEELKSTENALYTAFIKGGHGNTKVSFVLKQIPDEEKVKARNLLLGCMNPNLPEEEYKARKDCILSAQSLDDVRNED